MKRKIKAIIIHSNEKVRETLAADVVNTQDFLKAAQTESFEGYRGLNPTLDDQIFFIEERGEMENALRTTDEIRRQNEKALIYVVRRSTAEHDATKDLLRSGFFDGSLELDESTISSRRHVELQSNALAEYIKRKRDAGAFHLELVLGIVGMGHLGQGLVREAVGVPSIKKILGYTFNNKDPAYLKLSRPALGGDKIEPAESLEQLVEESDIVAVCRGPYFKSNKDAAAFYSRSRPIVTKDLLKLTLPLLEPVYSALSNAKNPPLAMFLPHPPSIWMQVAKDRYEFPANMLAAPSADADRSRVALQDFFATEMPMFNNLIPTGGDLFVDALGHHGEYVIPHWEDARIHCHSGSEKLFDVMRGYGDDPSLILKADPVLTQRVIDMGRDIMTMSKSSGQNYFETQRRIVEQIVEIAELRTQTSISWTHYVDMKTLNSLIRSLSFDEKKEMQAERSFSERYSQLYRDLDAIEKKDNDGRFVMVPRAQINQAGYITLTPNRRPEMEYLSFRVKRRLLDAIREQDKNKELVPTSSRTTYSVPHSFAA